MADAHIAKEIKEIEIMAGERGRLWLALPFDPDAVWGTKPRHLVHGFIAGIRWRGTVEMVKGAPALVMGPAWVRDNPLRAGETVDVSIQPDGPQRTAGNAAGAAGIDADIAAALEAEPAAAAFFDGLAQFYRKAYLKWIDGTKKRPEERARRIAETVSLLKQGVKQRI